MSDKDSHHLLLRVPTPVATALSCCEATPRGMKHWLHGLPRANLGEMARQLYQALIQLNQLRTPSENRLQLLELLRPEVQMVCHLLERNFLHRPLVLDERPRKVASLCQALQHHLAIGYKLVVVRLASPAGQDRQPLLAIALQRALSSLRGLVVRASQLYCPVPEGVWLDLHRLHAIGRERNLQRTPVRDELVHHTASSSIEQAYLAALLLGGARCNQIRQQQIAGLAEVLEAWSALTSLTAAGSRDGLFVVLPQADGPPRYRAQIPAAEAAGGIGLETGRLVEAIERRLAGETDTRSGLVIPDGMNDDLLRHLATAWGSTAERSFQRKAGGGTLDVCVGMSAVHFFLAGERVFDKVIAQPQAGSPARFSLQGGEPDVWARAFDAQSGSAALSLAGDSIEFRPARAEEEAETSFPVHPLGVVNHSPGGYCLAWPGETPAQLQAGELLGLRDSVGWQVAVVRWLRLVRGAGTQMGVELLGPSAEPCGIRLVRKQEQGSQYLRGLLLPPIAAISRPATVIAPRLPFQEGHKVLLAREGQEHRAVLSRRIAGTGSYSEFEYRSLEVKPQPETFVTAGKTGPAGPDEDFDSLWKSL